MDTDIVSRQKVGRGIYKKKLRVVKNVTCDSTLQMKCFMQDYPGPRPQLERGALDSAVIAGGVKVKLLKIWFCGSVGGQARTYVDLLDADIRVPRGCLPAKEKESHGGSTEIDLVVVVVALKYTCKCKCPYLIIITIINVIHIVQFDTNSILTSL